MKIQIFTLLICFGLCACNNKRDPIDENIHLIVQETQDEIEKTYNAKLSAVGLGGMHGVRNVSINFCLQKSLSLKEARQIIVNSTQLLLNNINSNTALRPFLAEYPFPPSRVSISFWIRDELFHPIKTPNVLYSFELYQNMIEYTMLKKRTAYERDDKKILMHSETLEEAKRIVENEKSF